MLVRSDVRDLFARGLNGLTELDPGERVGFMAVLSSISRTVESFYFQTLNGNLDATLFEGWLVQYLDLLANQGASEFWEMRRHQYTGEFVVFLEERIRLHSAMPLFEQAGR